MMKHEAEQLAVRISQSFPNSRMPADIWIEELLGLHERQAETTLKNLRRRLTHAPSIREFVEEYRSLTLDEPGGPTCERCASTGWMADRVSNHPEHWPGDSERRPAGLIDLEDNWCPCNVVVPCDCPAGRSVRAARRGRPA